MASKEESELEKPSRGGFGITEWEKTINSEKWEKTINQWVQTE